MSFKFRSKVVSLLVVYGLLIGSTIPVSALNTVDSEPYDIFEKLTIDVASDQKYVPEEILVKFNPGVSEEKIKNINAGHGTQVTYTSPYAGFKILKIPKTKTVEEMAEIYSKNPNVEYAVPNAVMYAFMVPNDQYYDLQWNFKAFETGVGGGINLEPAWDTSTGEGAVVAVLDTGIAYETNENYIVAPDLTNTKFVSGYDFVNNDAYPNDDNGHGTHVTGTIAQSTNNGIGVAGVAYNCFIMPVKVLNGEGSGTLAQIADGIYYATEHGADIISMSLGYHALRVDPVLKAALDTAYSNGVTIVAAAGNDNTRFVSYPAAYEKCIAVGATRYDGNRAYYSNYGDALDIVAPGGDIRVDQSGDGNGDGILQNTFNTATKDTGDFGYWFFQGTSMATPHVSGVAALLISSKPDATPDEVRAALQNTATDLGTSGWDKYYGYGLVNATAALEYINPTSDNVKPTISDVSAIASVSSATITWNTDEASNSTVRYSTDTSSFEERSNPTMVTSHTVELTELIPATIYYYEVLSSDAAGNIAIDNNTPVYYTFTTLPQDTEPPVITNVNANAGTDTATITWNTDEASNSTVIYWKVDGTPLRESVNIMNIAHVVELHSLDPSTTYSYNVTSTDASGNTNTSENYEFITGAAPAKIEMWVNNISMGIQKAGISTRGLANVRVDGVNGLVEGATIYGSWEFDGKTLSTTSGITDSSGNIELTSDWVKKAKSGTFTFKVAEITKEGYVYNSTRNLESSDSIAI